MFLPTPPAATQSSQTSMSSGSAALDMGMGTNNSWGSAWPSMSASQPNADLFGFPSAPVQGSAFGSAFMGSSGMTNNTSFDNSIGTHPATGSSSENSTTSQFGTWWG
jgi:predicted NodU family carbamoyl transferase